ncbi:MAG TPA: glycosyltransferase family 2 protein [Fibrobacteria bacterium]|nr:glycosyltransferase family 2 protein [Fibrobacteria bacterium]
MELTVIVPVHNEEEALRPFDAAMRAAFRTGGLSGRILYVNDGSTDGSARVLSELNAEVITLDLNRGYGAAIKTGILHAETEYLAIIDADGTYLAEDIPRLFPEMKTCDMVVGRRPREKGLRRMAKGFLQSIASYAVDYPIPDINSGLRIFSLKLARDLFRLLPNGFSLTSTITLGALYTPYRVRYIPIEYRSRTGRSKIKKVRALFNFTMLILRTMVLFNPLKFFLPASALLGALGSAFLIRDLLAEDIAQGSILLLVNALILFAIGLLAEAIRCRE